MNSNPMTLTRAQAEDAAADPDQLARIIGMPFARWARQCHAISTKLLYSGAFGDGRIARGACAGVGGQHSWIVLGNDCYDPEATVVDPVLWSYRDDVAGVWTGRNRDGGWHVPFGSGSFLQAGMPCTYGGDPVELAPRGPLSEEAADFLDLLGMLDLRGWSEVAHLPVEGWPAAEILGAMCDTPGLGALVPIDIKGMLLGRVPGYRWPENEQEALS